MSELELDRPEHRRALMEVALGKRPADLYIKNSRLVNVYSGEILEGHDVAIAGNHFAYVGPPDSGARPGEEVVDAEGSYLIPGFVDAHAHVDFFANPLSLTPHLLASGTTAAMADPHEAVGALGLPGLDMLVRMTRNLPLKFYFSVPVATPPFPEVEGGPVLSFGEVAACLERPEIRAVSEVTPWGRLISCDADLLSKFELAQLHERRIEGHTTGASPAKLNVLVAAGLTSCHEALDAQEARERLRLGLYVMLRHGSIRRDLDSLVDLVKGESRVDTSRVLLTPDWMDPQSILEQGYMNSLVRAAVERGVEPVMAIQMATLNPARYLGLDARIGGVAPGRLADLSIVDDLADVTPRIVIADGRVVARNGAYEGEPLAIPAQALEVAWLPHRVLPEKFRALDFEVESHVEGREVTVPAIRIMDKTITLREDVTLPVQDGYIELPEGADVLKMALLNTQLPGFRKAFLTGFGAAVGGLASSLAHETHRPMVIGRQAKDMALALDRMRQLGGGIVLAQDGEVVSEIPLQVGGLMSVESLEELANQIGRTNAQLREMGCTLDSPVFTVGFLTFSPLPWIRLTPYGLRDVRSGSIVWPPSAG